MGFLRGKIHHFSGHFKDVRRFLEPILYAKRPEVSMMYKSMAYLSIVCYKLDETGLDIYYAST